MLEKLNQEKNMNDPIDNINKKVYAPIHKPVLKVIGLGGGGCNAVERMIDLGLKGVEFIAANTDRQALERNGAPTKIQLGPNITRGLGAGGRPEIGRQAAEESKQELVDAIDGADMVFLTAGMGGGTGTGSISLAGEIARSTGAVTIAIVTTPFGFEMGTRQKNAQEGLTELREYTNTLITIPNDRLVEIAPTNLPIEAAFCLADDVLRKAVQGITELITEPGIINVDFSHVRRMMKLGGGALMTIGEGKGETRAQDAIKQALYDPMLDDVSIGNATGIIVNITANEELTLYEVNEALKYVNERANPNAEIILGTTRSEAMDDHVQVILIVTGLGAKPADELMGLKKPLLNLKPERSHTKSDSLINDQKTVFSQSGVHSNVPNDIDIPAFMRK